MLIPRRSRSTVSPSRGRARSIRRSDREGRLPAVRRRVDDHVAHGLEVALRLVRIVVDVELDEQRTEVGRVRRRPVRLVGLLERTQIDATDAAVEEEVLVRTDAERE